MSRVSRATHVNGKGHVYKTRSAFVPLGLTRLFILSTVMLVNISSGSRTKALEPWSQTNVVTEVDYETETNFLSNK